MSLSYHHPHQPIARKTGIPFHIIFLLRANTGLAHKVLMNNNPLQSFQCSEVNQIVGSLVVTQRKKRQMLHYKMRENWRL